MTFFKKSWSAFPIPAMLVAGFLEVSLCLQVARGQQTGNFDEGEIQVLHVQGNVYLLAGAGGNVTIQAGEQGVVLVDTGSAQLADKTLAAIRKVSTRPIRYIIDTAMDADHTGGNEKLASAGITVFGALFQSNNLDALPNAQLVAHENVYNRMSGLTGGKRSAPPGVWSIIAPPFIFAITLLEKYFEAPLLIRRVAAAGTMTSGIARQHCLPH